MTTDELVNVAKYWWEKNLVRLFDDEYWDSILQSHVKITRLVSKTWYHVRIRIPHMLHLLQPLSTLFFISLALCDIVGFVFYSPAAIIIISNLINNILSHPPSIYFSYKSQNLLPCSKALFTIWVLKEEMLTFFFVEFF
jgi:hypothetical protein